jgi:hypothetical protein
MSKAPDFLSAHIDDISAEIIKVAHTRGVLATKLAALAVIGKLRENLDPMSTSFLPCSDALSDAMDAIFELEVPA